MYFNCLVLTNRRLIEVVIGRNKITDEEMKYMQSGSGSSGSGYFEVHTITNSNNYYYYYYYTNTELAT